METQEEKEETSFHFKALDATQMTAAVANTQQYFEVKEQQWIKFSSWYYKFLCKTIHFSLKVGL